MKQKYLAAILLFPLFSFAQIPFMKDVDQSMQDIKGKPISLKVESDGYNLEGSPFFNNDYCRANIKIFRGMQYSDIPLKLNLQDNEVTYRLPDGREMMAVTPIEKIEFTGCGEAAAKIFRSGFPSVDKQTEKNFYEVLDSGNVVLLKLYKVSFRDEKPFNSATTTRKFETTPVYYTYTVGKGMMRIDKTRESVLSILSNKKNEVDTFISGQNIKLKKEEDIVKLFVYYNSLN